MRFTFTYFSTPTQFCTVSEFIVQGSGFKSYKLSVIGHWSLGKQKD